jgi:hypothetical protein
VREIDGVGVQSSPRHWWGLHFSKLFESLPLLVGVPAHGTLNSTFGDHIEGTLGIQHMGPSASLLGLRRYAARRRNHR